MNPQTTNTTIVGAYTKHSVSTTKIRKNASLSFLVDHACRRADALRDVYNASGSPNDFILYMEARDFAAALTNRAAKLGEV